MITFEEEKDLREIEEAGSVATPQERRVAALARRIDKELLEEKTKRVNRYADAERIVAWIRNPQRAPASSAFTEGPERQIAYVFEAIGMRLGEVPEREHAGDCCLCRADLTKIVTEQHLRLELEKEGGVLQGRREACEVWNEAGYAGIAADTLKLLRARDAKKV